MAYFLADGTFVIENDNQPMWKNYSKHNSMQHDYKKDFTVCSENYNNRKQNVRMEMIPRKETQSVSNVRMEMVPRKETRMEMIPRRESNKPNAETKYATVEFKSSRKPFA